MSNTKKSAVWSRAYRAGPLLPLVVLLLLVGSFVELDLSRSEHYLRRMVDFLHLPVFFVLSWLLTDWFVGEEHSFLNGLFKAVACCLFLGAATEIFQPLFGREGSLSDFWLDLLGTLAGASFSLAMRSSSAGWLKTVSCILLAISVCMGSMPVYTAWSDWRVKMESFPVLVDLENGRYRDKLESWWKPVSEESTVSLKERGLLVQSHSGGVVYEALGQNWLNYQSLSLTVFNPGHAFTLYLRIDDSQDTTNYSDRFNRKLELSPGLNSFEIPVSEIENGPKSRKLDLSSISFFYIFVLPEKGEPEKEISQVWELKDVRLLSSSGDNL